MKKNLSFVFFGMGMILLRGESLSFGASELAKVNNTVITLEEFNKKYQESTQFYQLKPPTKKQVLDELIKHELGVQEAKRIGLDKDPEVLERISTLLYHSLLEKKLTKEFEEIHISDDEAQAYYNKNPEIRTSHIFAALLPNASSADQKKAYERLKKIKDEQLADGKMSFAEIAQRFSEGPTAQMGGDVDYQSREKLDPNYYETAMKLSPGKVSGIIRTRYGYHIIKLTAIRPWQEADKTQVKRAVFEDLRAKIFEKYMNTLKTQSKVTIRSELIQD